MAGPPEPSPGRAAWASLLALSGGHFAVDCCTGIWPVYKTLAHLDLVKAGLIATLGPMVGNGLQVAFGLLADRGWRKRLLVGGTAMAGAVTLVPWTDSYPLMFVFVLATYVGSAAYHPSGTGAAGTVSRSRTGFMIGVFLAGGYLGYSLSQILFSAVYLRWARLSPVLALIPLAAAAGIALRVPESAAVPRVRGETWRLLRPHLPALGTLFLVQVFATAVNLSLIFLLPDLMVARNSPPWIVNGGGHFALVAGGCLSLLPAGQAADRWGARRVLLVANLATGVLLAALLRTDGAPARDLALVAAFGGFNGMNGLVTVAEGNRMLPGQTSGVSALLMGLPWCVAAVAPVISGLLAEPSRGGSPVAALSWLGLSIPLALLASACVRPRQASSNTATSG